MELHPLTEDIRRTLVELGLISTAQSVQEHNRITGAIEMKVRMYQLTDTAVDTTKSADTEIREPYRRRHTPFRYQRD